jgi:uncharacterized HhH-GPD family protein
VSSPADSELTVEQGRLCRMPNLRLALQADADELLSTEPAALLIGMLLDQQVAMETAFAGPKKISDRMGGFDVHRIADADPEDFATLCATPPAVHRFPGSMAQRTQALCRFLVERYDGKAEALWTEGDPDGPEVLRRLKALPGYGDQKARIFLALLGKQLGLTAPGWREAAGAYGEEGSHRSIADVVDERSLHEVRAFKKQQKAK